MKKLVNLMMLFAALITYTSCTNTVDDVFDKDPTERLNDALKNYKKILQEAPNGWIMYMYGDLQYGGYNVVAKFGADDNVTVSSENWFTPSETAVSHYRLDKSSGPILSFDEYNDIFHFYSDPVNPEGIGTNGEGFGGDLEFRFLSVTPEHIVLLGKKTVNRIDMYPVPANTTPEEYLELINQRANEMDCANIYITVNVGGEEIELPTTVSYRRFSITLTGEDGTTTTIRAPYVLTPNGYELYEPIELYGKTVTGFKYAPNSLSYDSFEGSDVQLWGVVPDLNKQLTTSQWFFNSYDDMGPVAGPAWKSVVDAIGNAENETFMWGYLGIAYYTATQADGTIYCCFNSGGYPCQVDLAYTLDGTDKINITGVTSYTSQSSNNSANYYNTYYSVGNNAIIPSFVGTFTLTTDNIKNPSYIEMTNGSNVIKLAAAYKATPFGTLN